MGVVVKSWCLCCSFPLGAWTPHTLPLLHHGILPTGDSPLQMCPTWLFPTSMDPFHGFHPSEKAGPVWIPPAGSVHRERAAPAASAWAPHRITNPASKPDPVRAFLSMGTQVLPDLASHGIPASFVHPPALLWDRHRLQVDLFFPGATGAQMPHLDSIIPTQAIPYFCDLKWANNKEISRNEESNPLEWDVSLDQYGNSWLLIILFKKWHTHHDFQPKQIHVKQ